MDHVIDDERGYRTDNRIGGVVSFGWQGISNTEDGCGKALDGAATDVEGERNMATDEDEGGTAPGPSLFTSRLGGFESTSPYRFGARTSQNPRCDGVSTNGSSWASLDLALVKAAYLSIVVTGVHVKAEPIHSFGEMISRRKREHSSPRKPLGEGPLSPKHFLGSQRRPYNDSSRNTTDGRISLNRASRYTVSIIMVSQRAILEGVQHSVPNASFGLKGDIFLDGNESIHPDEIHCARVQRVENNSSDRNDNL
ncbi:hypothetical protein MJO29_016143 [Puccinia striiformis f. sp. tritici]|nr:hypothetical protein MJO29_016143 [Puccinia striiformis f. sp. tritici]